MLEAGSVAPCVALEDTTGTVVNLSDYHDKQSVLLYFVRSVSCPVCTRHVKDLVRSRARFAAVGVEVLIAVPEDRGAAAAWKAKNGIPFLVVTGRRGSPHEAFGLARKLFGSMRQSGSVLIDPHGVVRHSHSATVPTGSYDRKAVAAAIEDLGTTADG
ncbi:MAG: peroxiredoxin family protein [Kutzneria sp.]|nr:peroxiredoxin family protein [Kutzneria sp.]